jgi:hypothetical protein
MPNHHGGGKKGKKHKNAQPSGHVGAAVAATEFTYWGGYISVRANMDPAHPLSYPRLGRWIDLPDVEVPYSLGQAGLDAAADQALAEASLIPMRVRLTTQVMVRGLNEVYELDMSDSYGDPIPSGQGRYWCRGWSLQLGAPWEMVHNLTRVVPFTAVSWDET